MDRTQTAGKWGGLSLRSVWEECEELPLCPSLELLLQPKPIIWMWSVTLEVSPWGAYVMAVLTRELLRTLRHLAVRDSSRAPHSLWNGTSWSHLALDRSNSSELLGLFPGLNQRACVEHSTRSGIWEGFDETINIVKNLRLSATEIYFLCQRHRYNAQSGPIS